MHVKQSKIYWRYIKVNPLSFPWWGPNIFDGSTYVIPMWISAHEFNSIDFHEHLKRNFFFWRITQWLCYPFFQNLFFCLSRLGIIDTQGFFFMKRAKGKWMCSVKKVAACYAHTETLHHGNDYYSTIHYSSKRRMKNFKAYKSLWLPPLSKQNQIPQTRGWLCELESNLKL